MNATQRRRFRPTLEVLESRVTPAGVQDGGLTTSVLAEVRQLVQVHPPSLRVNSVVQAPATGQAIGQRIAAFAQAHLHQKIGGGECAHLVSEALRVAGANFIPQDPNHNGDYVWGNLVTQITAQGGRRIDANPSAAVQVGDIIQFQNVTMSNGATYSQHTAIVASVDAHGRPNAVYEQNVGINGAGRAEIHDRTDRLDPINLNLMVSGAVHIYRAAPRQDAPDKLQYSVVNDTNRQQRVTVSFDGTPTNTMTLDSFNTQGSYRDGWGQGNGSWTLSVGGQTIALHNASGYEIYTVNGRTAIRQI